MNDEEKAFDKFVEHEFLPYKEKHFEKDISKRNRRVHRKVTESNTNLFDILDNEGVQTSEVPSSSGNSDVN